MRRREKEKEKEEEVEKVEEEKEKNEARKERERKREERKSRGIDTSWLATWLVSKKKVYHRSTETDNEKTDVAGTEIVAADDGS